VAERQVITAAARIEPDPGLVNLLDALADPRVARSVRRGAVSAAGNVVAAAARASTAYRRRTGQLAETVRVRTKPQGDEVQGFVIAGSRTAIYRRGRTVKGAAKGAVGYNVAYYAGWVERGTRPHFIPRTRVVGRSVAFGGRVFAQVRHPGAQPTRFMSKALIATQGALGGAMDAYMVRRLRRIEQRGKAG
jgi:hypothetical protein